MAFETLLGNERLKDNLIRSLRNGRTSHFYLISGPEGSGKHTLARLLAAGLMCQAPEKPCMYCTACRKVLQGLHPDFIEVDDPEKKTVPVALIRQTREDMFIRPNEGQKKIYLFPRAQDMGVPGQNALLKVLEEPPSYGVFLLLADNPEKLLPTVRSRCVELSLLPLPEDTLARALQQEFPQALPEQLAAAISRSGGFLGQAKALLAGSETELPQTEDFVRAFAGRDSLLLTQTLVPMEKWKREDLLAVLERWTELLTQAMMCRSGLQALWPLASQLAAGRSAAELKRAADNLQKASQFAQANVSVAAICGWLVWALR